MNSLKGLNEMELISAECPLSTFWVILAVRKSQNMIALIEISKGVNPINQISFQPRKKKNKR